MKCNNPQHPVQTSMLGLLGTTLYNIRKRGENQSPLLNALQVTYDHRHPIVLTGDPPEDPHLIDLSTFVREDY